MATKKLLAEQVRYRLDGGYPDISASVQEPDVIKAIEQEINLQLKMQHFSVSMPLGETIPDNAFVATYTGVAVSKLGNKSQAIMPVMPISLPRNQAIHQVYDANSPDTPFIPILSSQKALIRVDDLLDGMLGQNYYYPKGKTLVFSKDLTLLGINSVTMELVVMDFSSYTNTDMLPLPTDMEAGIVDAVFKRFIPVPNPIPINDNYSTARETQPK